MRIGVWTPSVDSLNPTSVADMDISHENVHQKEKVKEKAKRPTEKERQKEKERTKDKAKAQAIWYAGPVTNQVIVQSIAPKTKESAMLRRGGLQFQLALKRWNFRLEECSG